MGIHIRRRECILTLGGAAMWPITARVQQAVIGLLSGASFDERYYAPLVAKFRLGLEELGFVEGRNLTIEYRTADGHPERLQDLAADLVRRQVAVSRWGEHGVGRQGGHLDNSDRLRDRGRPDREWPPPTGQKPT